MTNIVATPLALSGLQSTRDFWAIGPLLDTLVGSIDRKGLIPPLADLLSHVDSTNHLTLSSSQRKSLHRLVAEYDADRFAKRYPSTLKSRRLLLEGALHAIDLLEDISAIPALEKLNSRTTVPEKERVVALLEKLRALAAQQSGEETLVRAAQTPMADLLHPAEAESQDKNANNDLIRPV